MVIEQVALQAELGGVQRLGAEGHFLQRNERSWIDTATAEARRPFRVGHELVRPLILDAGAVVDVAPRIRTGGAVERTDRRIARYCLVIRVEAREGVFLVLFRVTNTRDDTELVGCPPDIVREH